MIAYKYKFGHNYISADVRLNAYDHHSDENAVHIWDRHMQPQT